MHFQVNLNGTPANRLMEHWSDVKDAARELQSVLQEALPNGRDYQTLDDAAAALSRDRDKWAELMNMARAIERYAFDVQLEIQRQTEPEEATS